jgi:hypothetical protein
MAHKVKVHTGLPVFHRRQKATSYH